MSLIFTTHRLVIKKPEITDKQSLIDTLNNWEIVKWLVKVPFPYTPKDADNWITDLSKNDYVFNIFLDSKLIGGIGLERENKNSDYALGYWLSQDHWGKGYVTEACKRLFTYATQDLKITKIKSAYFINNYKSAKILKNFGFQEIGRSSKYSLSRNKEVKNIELELTF